MAALIQCPTCKRQISKSAAACPSCGEPASLKPADLGRVNWRDPVHVVGVAAAAIAAAVLLLGLVAIAMEMNESHRLKRQREQNLQRARIERAHRL